MQREKGQGKDAALSPVTAVEDVGEMFCCSLLPDHMNARGQRQHPDFVPETLMGVRIS